MKSFQQIAQVAYTALAQEAAKRDGAIAPTWAQLSPEVQAAWVVAMQAVVAELESVH